MSDTYAQVPGSKGPVANLLYEDVGQGSHAMAVAVRNGAGQVVQSIPDYPSQAELIAAWSNFNEVLPGDFVAMQAYSNGQKVTSLSAGPLTPGESRISLAEGVATPCALEIEASAIRNRQQFATLTMYANGEEEAPDSVPNPINILSIYQSSADNGVAYNAVAGTIVTVNLETALPAWPELGAVFLSDWVHVVGMVDSRLNYQNATIKYISPDRKRITFGFSDESALPSLAIASVTPTLGTAKVYFYNNMGGASDGFGIRLTGLTATSAAVISLFGSGDVQVSGNLLGDHRVSIGSTAPVYSNSVVGNLDLKASSRYRLEMRPHDASLLDKPVDSQSQWAVRANRTAVKPTAQHKLKPRFRIYQPPGMSRPVAKIVSISKTGTTTATVVTDVPHGLAIGNVIGVYGVRDQTNFAAGTGTVTAVPTSTQIQLVLGAAVTATSYGGGVSIINGGAAQPGQIGQSVSSIITSPENTDWLQVTGTASWSGLSIGDFINLYGVRVDPTGADALVDGAWEVANIATSVMTLKPITDVFGVRVSPATPNTASVNCGGLVILRTTVRAHDIMLEKWTEAKVMVDGAGSGRADKAIPVQVVGTAGSVSVQGQQGNNSSTVPNPVLTSVVGVTANPSAGTAGRHQQAIGTLIGVPVTKPYCIPEAEWAFTGALTTTSDVVAKAAAGAGLKNHFTWVQATNTGASANDLIIKDGTTVRLQITVPAGQSVVSPIPTGVPLTANSALNVALSAAGTVRVNFLGYVAP